MDKLLKARLNRRPHKFTSSFNASHQFDRRLYQEDLEVSQAHIKMLKSIGILKPKEYQALAKGLRHIGKLIETGKLEWSDDLEDVHMHIEAQLISELGELGKKLHTGRSRNDQVATDLRLWTRKAIDQIKQLILELCLLLAKKAQTEYKTLMPGFTHLQAAQPISCGHHLMAWYSMLYRDYERFCDCRKRVDQLPLGAAALAGTSFPVDRKLLAKELGFSSIMENSIDAVSSRDFVIEFNAAAAICMQHLSRWSEELIIWNSSQFSFVNLEDALCTSSSIMPQKKNPDLAELVRGKSGRVFGNLTAILVVMKAQTLAYNKDNQEDKELLFDTVDSLMNCLQAWLLLVQGLEFKHENMAKALNLGYVNATRLADYLVAKQVPFRTAYNIVGKLVRLAQHKHKPLAELSLAEMQQGSEKINADIYELLDYANIIAEYDHLGGTAPKRVRQAAQKAIRQIERLMAANN